MLISSGFLDSSSVPCGHLREHFGTERLNNGNDGNDAISGLEENEVQVFVDRKLPELDRYDEELDKIEKQKTRMKSGEMTKEEFAILAQSILGGCSDS